MSQRYETTDSERVGSTMLAIGQGRQHEEELYFDPASGALSVARKGIVIDVSDRIPATTMAREGFFATR